MTHVSDLVLRDLLIPLGSLASAVEYRSRVNHLVVDLELEVRVHLPEYLCVALQHSFDDCDVEQSVEPAKDLRRAFNPIVLALHLKLAIRATIFSVIDSNARLLVLVLPVPVLATLFNMMVILLRLSSVLL